MTFLEAINQVLIRLREPEATSVATSKYVKLIAALVNESKRAVEDAANWTALLQTKTVTTVAGTSDYAVTGTGDRSSIRDVVNESQKAILKRCQARDLIKLKQIDARTARPDRWAVVGLDATTGALTLRLFPTPDAVYTYSVNCVIPADELQTATDEFDVPWEPIVMRAYAYALKERGEDQGASFQEALDQYRRVLSRYLVLNGSAAGGGAKWQVR